MVLGREVGRPTSSWPCRCRNTLPVSARPAFNEVEVTAYDPDKELELSSISGPTPFVYRYRLDPVADNATHLRLDGAISGEGLGGPMALLRPLAENFFRRGMIDNLESLRRLIENASSRSLRTSTDTIQTSPPSKSP